MPDSSQANGGQVCGDVKHALRVLISSKRAGKALSVTAPVEFSCFKRVKMQQFGQNSDPCTVEKPQISPAFIF